MEQLEEDCEAVILIVCIHPEGPCFFLLRQYIFLCPGICSFVREGMGMIGDSFLYFMQGQEIITIIRVLSFFFFIPTLSLSLSALFSYVSNFCDSPSSFFHILFIRVNAHFEFFLFSKDFPVFPFSHLPIFWIFTIFLIFPLFPYTIWVLQGRVG